MESAIMRTKLRLELEKGIQIEKLIVLALEKFEGEPKESDGRKLWPPVESKTTDGTHSWQTVIDNGVFVLTRVFIPEKRESEARVTRVRHQFGVVGTDYGSRAIKRRGLEQLTPAEIRMSEAIFRDDLTHMESARLLLMELEQAKPQDQKLKDPQIILS
ncbi:MAG: hypothetical protein UW69_C0034G0002 [Microgenomates group bacterium GW2011_GWA2_44_7]|nr:MAG: hypothetical protein UW69_C0034G0002 [Microgenomates group bacterium GW2011_GWA2_44_7]